MRYVRLRERPPLALDRLRVVFHHILNRHGHFVSRGVWEANIEYCVLVILRQVDCTIDRLDHIRTEEFSVPKNPDRGSVSLEELSVLGKLGELEFCERHERVHLVAGSLEILDAEGVHCYRLYSTLVAYFYDLVVLSAI